MNFEFELNFVKELLETIRSLEIRKILIMIYIIYIIT